MKKNHLFTLAVICIIVISLGIYPRQTSAKSPDLMRQNIEALASVSDSGNRCRVKEDATCDVETEVVVDIEEGEEIIIIIITPIKGLEKVE